jgi:hypothetical protein
MVSERSGLYRGPLKHVPLHHSKSKSAPPMTKFELFERDEAAWNLCHTGRTGSNTNPAGSILRTVFLLVPEGYPKSKSADHGLNVNLLKEMRQRETCFRPD